MIIKTNLGTKTQKEIDAQSIPSQFLKAGYRVYKTNAGLHVIPPRGKRR